MTKEEAKKFGLRLLHGIMERNNKSYPVYANDVKQAIDALSETSGSSEIPNDLKEAADNHIRKVVDTAGHPGWDWTTQDIADAFIAGAKWDRQQMLKDAVEVTVEDWNTEPHPEITIPLNPEKYSNGDNVRVIVIPNTDEK